MKRLFVAAALASLPIVVLPFTAAAQGNDAATSAGATAAASKISDADRTQGVAVIEKLHETILDVMKSAKTLGYQGRYDKLAPVMTSVFDLDFMAEKSAGRHWKDFDAAQQKRWTDTFARHLIATYAGRFVGFSGQTFETLGNEPSSFDTLMVRTRLVQPADEDVSLNYRMRKMSTGWRIVDIYLSGTVSELALRRAEYGSVIERQGLDKLIEQLEAKIKDFEAGAIDAKAAR